MKLVKITYGGKRFYAIQKGRIFKRYASRGNLLGSPSWHWRRKTITDRCLFHDFHDALRSYHELLADHKALEIEEITDLEKELK